jgi:hypothetical protein
MKLIIFLLLTNTCFAQIVYSGGAGLSLNFVSVNAFAEAGTRVGSAGYIGAQVNFRSSNYPGLSAAPIIGYAWSWNNNKIHELTTLFYAKADYPIMANSGYKSYSHNPFGFGVRHYIYNTLVDLSYQQSQVQLTIGYSLNKIYK